MKRVQTLVGLLLRTMALLFFVRPSLRALLRGRDGWLDFSVGFTTQAGTVAWTLSCGQGRLRVHRGLRSDVDVTLRFADDAALLAMLRSTPQELLDLILRNRLIADGSWSHLQLFNYLLSRVRGSKPARGRSRLPSVTPPGRPVPRGLLSASSGTSGAEPGVVHLAEPYLSAFSLDDFPRLRAFLDDHLQMKPEVCPERPVLMTEWFRRHGFEHDSAGRPWHPGERQGKVFEHLMRYKTPVIREGDLLPGSTTRHPTAGSVVYPDAQGTMVWGELDTISERPLIPFDLTPETARVLHHDVFPYWTRRNFRAWLRAKHGEQLCQQLDERWVAYFVWKSVGVSHTVPDLRAVLTQGTGGLGAALAERAARAESDDARRTYQASCDCLAGVEAYASHLADHAQELARHEREPTRQRELSELGAICRRVPREPATTLHEALTSLWLIWVALHNENNDTGLSLGRLDQLLQPYFLADMARLSTEAERQRYIAHALELTGAFFLRLTDHFPLSPDIGNTLFGGASSTQAVTLGGVTPDGADAVNDMTYVLLKVTEMLSVRDVNINARFKLGVNSDAYLRRLCEVNVVTAGTPSMHSDDAVLAALAPHGYSLEERRDWSATGCVEPTITGKHMGHTGSILMNLVAGLEMALNDGRHPLIGTRVGPATGEVASFATFEAFFQAWSTQQAHLITQAVTLNNQYAAIHAEHRPTPLLSALMGGTLESGRDVTRGGATYNTSGTSNIGLADVTDSLLVIEQLVFAEQRVSFTELAEAIRTDFANHAALAALARSRVPLFGSGAAHAVEMANRVARRVHELYGQHTNYRGGPYTSGFWSMSQHVAYGTLSGALPSGRRATKAFTPGLTPQPIASRSFLDNIRDVAALDPTSMDNNMAFNVKLVPSPSDGREKTVHTMQAYVKTYFEQGGMQIQFNVVTADTLRDAMAHPEAYRGLLVRISGYNAYFVTLNEAIQRELIERTEFGL